MMNFSPSYTTAGFSTHRSSHAFAGFGVRIGLPSYFVNFMFGMFLVLKLFCLFCDIGRICLPCVQGRQTRCSARYAALLSTNEIAPSVTCQ